MRRVTLPPDSVRGGILTDGTVLVVTSNPTRTSPVKRGLFVLDNILGTPPPPPPPNIPPLEDAAKGLTNQAPTLRETLAEHRNNPLCAPAITAWTRWVWPWRTSMPWACGAPTNSTSPSTPPAH